MISAIIVNYFSADVLYRCLSSLEDVSEIIIIDNSNSPEEKKGLEALGKQFSNLILIYSSRNVGFSAAVNQAASLAKEPYLLIINPDAYFEKGALTRLHKALQQPGAGVVGPRILFPDGKEQLAARRKTPTPGRALIKLFGLSRLGLNDPLDYGPLPDTAQEVEALSGSCFLLSSKVFEELGGLDEGYTFHCEDLDLFMRLREKGYKVIFVPDALAFHEKGHSSTLHPFWVSWHLHKGMLRYYQKFFRHKYPWLLWSLVVIGVYLRFCIHSLGTSISISLKR